jgi:hypothetical protein
MVSVSLTKFVDFVTATGTARLSKVREMKRQQSTYSPQTDYWKPLRDRIEKAFAEGWDSRKFKDSLAEVRDEKKLGNYEACRKGLTRWAGKKEIAALPGLKRKWSAGDLEVTVNPELHLAISGDPYLIKLYPKADPLTKQKVNVVLHLLQQHAPANTTVGILDLRRGKLLIPTVAIDGLDGLLKAEAAALLTLWEAI